MDGGGDERRLKRGEGGWGGEDMMDVVGVDGPRDEIEYISMRGQLPRWLITTESKISDTL